jgi:TetR/AcrR family transcriptional regulator, repressor for neighboring sulfatase
VAALTTRSTSSSAGQTAAEDDAKTAGTASHGKKEPGSGRTAAGSGKPRSPCSPRGSSRSAAEPAPQRGPGGTGKGKASDRVVSGQPHGRDEIIESIIDATLSLWSSQGPAKLSLRGIASRAGVNYGLVYRHFGTKDEVIRAALNRRLEKGLQSISGCEDLMEAMDVFLDQSTGSYARLLAWATLQYVLDDIMPPQDLVLQRIVELAKQDEAADDDEAKTAVLVGSLISMVYGWRLFGPYLVPELGLKDLSQAQLDALIREVMVGAIKAQA